MHRPLAGLLIYDNEDGIKKAADETLQFLKAIKASIMDMYEGVYSGTKKELEEVLDKGELLTPQEAVDYGFVDEYEKDKPEDKEDDKDISNQDKDRALAMLQVLMSNVETS